MVTLGLHAPKRSLLLALAVALLLAGHAGLVQAQVNDAHSLLLGTQAFVTLPAPGPEVPASEWKASVGTAVASATELRFEVPKTTYPQVALVGTYDAKARTPIVHRVLLVGQPTVEIRSEPNVEVSVRVGERSFGPTATDAKGVARLKIDAPPGTATVKTFATDSHGNVTEGQLALNPPAFPKALVLCAPIEDAAYVVEVDEYGTFVTTPSFRTRVREATASAPESVAPGVFRLPLGVQNPTKDWKTVTVTVEHAGFSDSCAFKVAPPPPSEPFKLQGTVTPIEPEFSLFLAANAGFATNFGLLAGPWVSVQGSYPFSSTRQGLRADLAVGFLHSTSDVPAEDGQTLELTVNSIPLLLGPRYVFVWGLFDLSVAAHAGLSLTNESLVGPLIDQASSSIPLWFGGDVGFAWWIGSGDVGVRVGYSYAPIDQPDVSGNVAGLRATVQYERGF